MTVLSLEAIDDSSEDICRCSKNKRLRVDDLGNLSFEEKVSKANSKLYRMLNASEQSTKKVRLKLANAGFEDDVVNYVISRAVEIGLIDDVRYCECLLRQALVQAKGPERVKREIESLGVDMYSLDSFRAYEEQGEDYHIEEALRYLASHPPRSKNIREGAFRKLVSRGYSMALATTASRRYAESLRDATYICDFAV